MWQYGFAYRVACTASRLFCAVFALLEQQDCKPPGRSGSPHRYRSQGHGSGLSPSFLIIAMIRHGWGASSAWGCERWVVGFDD